MEEEYSRRTEDATAALSGSYGVGGAEGGLPPVAEATALRMTTISLTIAEYCGAN